MVACRGLAIKKKLNMFAITRIDELHGACEGLELDMRREGCVNEKFKYLLKRWRENQRYLQQIWGFEINKHKWNEHSHIPFCLCPKLDNDELDGHYITNSMCPVHENN